MRVSTQRALTLQLFVVVVLKTYLYFMVVALLFFLQTEECLVISKVQPQFWIILTSITTFKTETTEEWVIGRSYTLQFFC